jgi:hypothetical protein
MSKRRAIFKVNYQVRTEENLKKADAIEIKVGRSAKPGMGGHQPNFSVGWTDLIPCWNGTAMEK